MNNIYKSPAQPWVSGSKIVFQLDFLPTRGPRGGRLAIEKVEVEAALNITTQAANTIVGADMAGFISLYRIWDAIGNRRYLPGSEGRVKMHEDMMGAAPDDPATHAASTTQTDTFKLFINFSQPVNARRRWDFAMPVDDLKGGGFEITCPLSTAQLLQTGSGAVINSGSYTLYVHCREEWDVEFHSRDVVEFSTQTLNSAWQVNIGGSLLKSMTVFKDAQGGGTAVSTFTDITIEPLGLIQMPRDVLVQGYLSRFPVKTAQDPIYNGKALPVLWARSDMKHNDLVAFPGSLLVRSTTTFTAPFDVIVHRIAPKDERMMRDAYRANGVDPRETPRIKTDGKTATDPKYWGDTGIYMPAKVSRPRGR